jgi:hypothetical protein
MNPITFDVLLAGLAATIAGLTLQMIGRAAFSRFKSGDTKEIAAVVGLRVSAIFGIAVGLIFASTTAHLMTVKKDVQEEARLVGTLYVLVADSPDIAKSGVVRDNLRQYLKLSQSEFEDPEGGERFAEDTNKILLKICRRMALNDQESAETRWTKEEFQRSCSKLIDVRGKKRVGTMENRVATPFWIFFGISFGFLAVLFGVFDRSIINIVFASLFYFATGVTGMLIYAASDPYHNPGKVSAAPLALLNERIMAAGDAEAPKAPGDNGDQGAPKNGTAKSGTAK